MKKKVTILGGGIAALTAAYYLTRTKELRQNYDITLYQMGWRLGGKLASGRESPADRNVEHGLHVWFGCYENAFRMTREVYQDYPKHPENPFQEVSDVLKKRSYTPIGLQPEGINDYYPLLWPENDEEPGMGELFLSPKGVITQLLSLLFNEVFHPLDEHKAHMSVPDELPTALKALPPSTKQTKHVVVAESSTKKNKRDATGWILHLVEDLWDDLLSKDGTLLRFALTKALAGVRDLARLDWPADENGRVPMPGQAADLALSLAIGLLDSRWNILVKNDLNVINPYEFRAWMLETGASPWVVNSGSFTTVLYNTMFAYDEGKLEQPNMEAGTGARILLRIVATYKGAVFWFVEAGMGEVVVSPLYLLLKERGVRFEFFHKVQKLTLSEDKQTIREVVFDVQAKLKKHLREEGEHYDPLIEVDHIPCWTKQPKWNLLEGGEAMSDKGVNFESHWCQEPPQGEIVLDTTDHEVVLGISMGAFKKLNDDPGMCDELIEANDGFRAMTENLGLVPSQAVQVWLKKDLTELGFKYKRENMEGTRPAMVSTAQPLDIWADMSQVLQYENWTGLPETPKSLHYFCGTYDTQLFKASKTQAEVPKVAKNQIFQSSVHWFEESAPSLWPGAQTEGQLDWDVFVDEKNRAGQERFYAQDYRANIDPTECCVTSLKNTTRFRLPAGKSGFINLKLAGTWTRTGLNATCVEGAVMSGMSCARAIIKSLPYDIVGENFLQEPE